MISKPPYQLRYGFSLAVTLRDLKASHYVTEYDIIRAAEDGDIKLLFRVPKDKKLILLPDPILLDYERPPIGRPPPDISPDYLVLLPHAACGFLRGGTVDTEYHATGYKDQYASNHLIRNARYLSLKMKKEIGKKKTDALLNSDQTEKIWIETITECPAEKAGQNSLFKIELQENPEGGTEQREWMYWGIDSGDPKKPIGCHTVSLDDILILTENFFNMKGWGKGSKPSSIYWDKKFTPKVEQNIDSKKGQVDYRSPQLLRMCEAASKFWGGVKPEDQCDSRTHPDSKVIIDWLLEREDLFSPSAAENAASLIKPLFATKAGRPEK